MNIDSIINPTRPTERQLKAAMAMTLAVCEVIRTAKHIPSGNLYASICDKVTLDGYQSLIRTIKNTGLVREEAHELIWIGPEISDSRTLSSPDGAPREL